MFVQVARQYRVNTHTKENSLARSNSSIAARMPITLTGLISVHIAGLIHLASPFPYKKRCGPIIFYFAIQTEF